MKLETEIDKGILLHQMFVVGKEEGARIIDKIKTKYPNHPFIAELEKTNNEK